MPMDQQHPNPNAHRKGVSVYAGIPFEVWEVPGGERYIVLSNDMYQDIVSRGAKRMDLLRNIGEKDPDDVMSDWIEANV